jgi:DNA-binding MarR family transcriptional regulator
MDGARLSELARSAGMSKQAMGDLVDQCEAWGLVTRARDARDARARRIEFTETGRAWVRAFQMAVGQAQREFEQEVGAEVAAVIWLGLEAYASEYR